MIHDKVVGVFVRFRAPLVCGNDAVKKTPNFVITHPEGYELNPEITKNSLIEYDQNKAFENADFIYTKNWSSYSDYGKITNSDQTGPLLPRKGN
jgi:ornithine carbamoyltransferase